MAEKHKSSRVSEYNIPLFATITSQRGALDMRWMAPPEKREIAWIFICLSIYFLAYNIDTSLEILGIDPAATKGAVLSRLGLGAKTIGKDGLKTSGWKDALEVEIFGDYEWLGGHVAGDGAERSQQKGLDEHGAQWIPRKDVDEIAGVQKPLGDSTIDDALQRWGDDLPQTHLVNHVPGYTVMDNVYILNGTVYLVSDNAQAFPTMSTIVTSQGRGFKDWKMLSVDEGRRILGKHGAIIRGVSWMAADTTPHNTTLFALWMTYSSINSAGRTEPAPPRRLIFPHTPFFTDPNPLFENHTIRRRRADTGFHPYTVKAAFPPLAIQYFEDWEDYQKMEIPFVYERLLVSDRSVATASLQEHEPVYSPILQLDVSEEWWEPIRKNMAQFLGQYEVKTKKKSVTYLHAQGSRGPQLSLADHEALVARLQKMAKKSGFELHVVSTETEQTDWTTRMTAIVKSSAVVSVHGNHLMDALFMKRTPQSTLVELFSADRFVKDRELAVHSTGLHYRAVRYNNDFDSELPPVSPPKDDEPIAIDVDTIARTIQEALSRS